MPPNVAWKRATSVLASDKTGRLHHMLDDQSSGRKLKAQTLIVLEAPAIPEH